MEQKKCLGPRAGWCCAVLLGLGLAAAGEAWAQGEGVEAAEFVEMEPEEAEPEEMEAMEQGIGEEAPLLGKAFAVPLRAEPPSPMRIGAYAAFGVAAAAGIGAIVVAGVADNTYWQYRKLYSLKNDERTIPSDKSPADAMKHRDRLNAQKAIAYATGGVAVAALAGGIVLFMLSPERAVAKAKRVQVGVGPLGGGAVLSIEGTF